MKALTYGWVGVLGLALAGCVESTSERLNNESEQEIQAYVQRNNLNVNKAESGIYYQTSFATTTPEYATGDRVAFRYKEFRLFDGQLIDSSGTEPVYYAAGSEFLTRADFTRKPMSLGLVQGLRLLTPGGNALLLVPGRLAYPNGGNPAVPPNGSVRLDVELISVTSEEQQIEQYISRNAIAVTQKDDNGLRFSLQRAAQGDSAKIGTAAQVKYTLYFPDGSLRQTATGTFSYSDPNIRQGFIAGIRKMKVGERAIVLFPSSLGYGRDGQYDQNTRKYSIPPYTPLIFDLEVLSITR
jgi:FKBP-type peptidyl-prolyl cis-trans isomerase